MDRRKYVLLPCTSKKSTELGQEAHLNDLSFDNEFHEIRRYLIEKYLDPDFIFRDKTSNQDRHLNSTRSLDWKSCLPAHQRYKGPIFSRVDSNNWQNADNVLIVSPLWGIIKPNDNIPDYSLIMTDLIYFKNEQINRGIWELWRMAFDQIFIDLQNNQTIKNPITLLFSKCSLGFSKSLRDSFVRPVERWRDNYGFQKGLWLNQYLSNQQS
jgi:cytoplasmic iron level regulating protein YaaA (DUF328/UPF0246 family)